MWALPYGAWVTAGSATVLTCEDPEVERAFAARNLRRADRIRQLGFEGLRADAGPEAVTLAVLREHALSGSGAAATLWVFQNHNQEPWLRTSTTRQGIVPFLRAMLADPDCRRGWNDLRRAMEHRNRSGRVVVDGGTAVARTLFDRDGHRPDQLPLELLKRSSDPDKVPVCTLRRWRGLCRLYLKVMYDMDADRLRPVAELLADWIHKESTRGRFNDYRRAAGSSYDLHKLLMTASARLFLDGRGQQPVTEVVPQLFADGPQGWRSRALLFFAVMEELTRRGVTVGRTETDADADTGDDHDDEAGLDEEPIRFSGAGNHEEEYA